MIYKIIIYKNKIWSLLKLDIIYSSLKCASNLKNKEIWELKIYMWKQRNLGVKLNLKRKWFEMSPRLWTSMRRGTLDQKKNEKRHGKFIVWCKNLLKIECDGWGWVCMCVAVCLGQKKISVSCDWECDFLNYYYILDGGDSCYNLQQ